MTERILELNGTIAEESWFDDDVTPQLFKDELNAGRRGQKKLDERNRQLRADGLTPRKMVFQTQKDFLRSAIEDAAAVSCSQEDFQKLLFEKYNVKLKVSRGRFSYLHPERNKHITGRVLGTHYEEDYLRELFKENAEPKENKKKTVDMEKYNTESEKSAPHPSNLLQGEAISILFIKSDLRLVVNLQAVSYTHLTLPTIA